jgi:hypothetical protein
MRRSRRPNVASKFSESERYLTTLFNFGEFAFGGKCWDSQFSILAFWLANTTRIHLAQPECSLYSAMTYPVVVSTLIGPPGLFRPQ